MLRPAHCHLQAWLLPFGLTPMQPSSAPPTQCAQSDTWDPGQRPSPACCLHILPCRTAPVILHCFSLPMRGSPTINTHTHTNVQLLKNNKQIQSPTNKIIRNTVSKHLKTSRTSFSTPQPLPSQVSEKCPRRPDLQCIKVSQLQAASHFTNANLKCAAYSSPDP